MTRRSLFGITIDILTLIEAGVKVPTNIQHKANLSFILLNNILPKLEKMELIHKYYNNETGSRYKYEITSKGKQMLSYLNTIDDLLEVKT